MLLSIEGSIARRFRTQYVTQVEEGTDSPLHLSSAFHSQLSKFACVTMTGRGPQADARPAAFQSIASVIRKHGPRSWFILARPDLFREFETFGKNSIAIQRIPTKY